MPSGPVTPNSAEMIVMVLSPSFTTDSLKGTHGPIISNIVGTPPTLMVLCVEAFIVKASVGLI